MNKKKTIFSNGQKVTGQKVTKLLGQKVTISIFLPWRTKSHNLYFSPRGTKSHRIKSHNEYGSNKSKW